MKTTFIVLLSALFMASSAVAAPRAKKEMKPTKGTISMPVTKTPQAKRLTAQQIAGFKKTAPKKAAPAVKAVKASAPAKAVKPAAIKAGGKPARSPGVKLDMKYRVLPK